MKSLVIAIMVSIMTSLSPPGRAIWPKEATETKAQAIERYHEIAEAIYEVAHESEPLFGGSSGRLRTAALLLAVAHYESGFRRDIDLGLARRKLSKYGWNDYGRSWCMLQLNLGKRGNDSAETTPQGWTGRQLLDDRTKCFSAGLEAMRRSMTACSQNAPSHRLAAYASGSCDKGMRASKLRIDKGRKVYERLVREMSLTP